MSPRRYEMSVRAKARERTREAILDAAVALFDDAWYDEVTLGDIAAAAGVSQQTVINHFGSKIDLYMTGIGERFAPLVLAERARATPGDVDSVIAAAVRDYERTGVGTWRLLTLAERVTELRPVIDGGRKSHREWIETMFAPLLSTVPAAARERVTQLLVVVLNVNTWHALRHEAGLDQTATAEHLHALVRGVLSTA